MIYFAASAPRVAVIREEGSNGDREMVAAFHMAGFEVWDVNTHDLTSGVVKMDAFRGVAFVGGFSYADVFGSAKGMLSSDQVHTWFLQVGCCLFAGWAAIMKYNDELRSAIDAFRLRGDTFSLGVCNGCQLGALVATDKAGTGRCRWDHQVCSVHPCELYLILFIGCQLVHLDHNDSERFESRFSTVLIPESPSIMLKGMAGSVLGVWVAHGEGESSFQVSTSQTGFPLVYFVPSSLITGKMVFRDEDTLGWVEQNHLVALSYVDDLGLPTEAYPLNPNGSPHGIAGLTSLDGRHLALMPHPERCVLPWQWPWMPKDFPMGQDCSPWFRMFQNAFEWCVQN